MTTTPTHPPIELVCLDMAGTTVDDGDAVMASFRVAATAAGLAGAALDDAMAYAATTMGASKIEVFRAILGDDDAAARANAAFEDAYADVVAAGGVRPVEGAVELFDRCRRDGIRTCLTTGFAPATRDAIVDRLGWGDLVDLVLSPADAGRGRPFPDMILTAVLRLGATSVASVAVAGDTTNDLLAGTRAGASIVAGVLTGAHTAEQLATAPHTHLLASVAELGPLLSR
ncbi:MAG: phosphonatase-like hydrolase [Ilumatobacteraceae bacterium]|nr:phosphonatase-like hydrolase [Ilumatobacteraceae bacterium]